LETNKKLIDIIIAKLYEKTIDEESKEEKNIN